MRRRVLFYKVTRAMVEGRENYGAVAPVMKTVAVKDWAQGYGVPLHPGAEKYYKEIGVVK